LAASTDTKQASAEKKILIKFLISFGRKHTKEPRHPQR